MPTFNADYSVPKSNTMEVAGGARAAFQEEEAALLSGLGLRDGGFKANADRVFMLDDTGKLITPPPYDTQKENGMTAAAQAGRLYVMDKDYRLRQVRLEGDEDDGFAFMVTNPLSLRQLPRLSMDYFIKCFAAIYNDFKRDISQTYNETMSKMKDSMSRIFGGSNQKNGQAELEANAEQLVSEDESLETEQTGTTLEQEQTKPWKYQTQDSRNMSNEAFFEHVKAAYERGCELNTDSALTGENCTPEAYYEVITRQLEAQVAGNIYDKATNAEDANQRNQILEDHKKTYTAIIVGLGGYVVSHTDQTTLAAHCSHPEEHPDAYHALSESAGEIVRTGIYGYLQQLNRENAANEQTKQQEQPKNEATLEHEAPKSQQEINPFVKG